MDNNNYDETPDYYNGPIGEKLSWRPVKVGGANFKTKRLVSENVNRIVFKPTIQMYLFSSIFIIVGLIVSAMWSSQQLSLAIFGLIFVAIGFGILYFASIPVIFDKSLGYFWQGRKEPSVYTQGNNKSLTKLDEIQALQILSERVSGSRNSQGYSKSYNSYELNLVLKDGSRKNVIDHGNYQSLVDDANVVANFLNVPVWNQMDHI